MEEVSGLWPGVLHPRTRQIARAGVLRRLWALQLRRSGHVHEFDRAVHPVGSRNVLRDAAAGHQGLFREWWVDPSQVAELYEAEPETPGYCGWTAVRMRGELSMIVVGSMSQVRGLLELEAEI